MLSKFFGSTSRGGDPCFSVFSFWAGVLHIIVPMIPIKMKGQERWFEFWAFVDSGATYLIFASEEAEALGLDMEQGRRGIVVVGDGSGGSPFCP